jgi:hypothetical protein
LLFDFLDDVVAVAGLFGDELQNDVAQGSGVEELGTAKAFASTAAETAAHAGSHVVMRKKVLEHKICLVKIYLMEEYAVWQYPFAKIIEWLKSGAGARVSSMLVV